ncbi:cation diffusion facilitator family transporter [Nocardioides bizhenqiangii]|uniref:Cation diffusion facilitator family transporter n=1 Tax=Nocardioides bizhenqiangii TaxID=3095076 RepID=A0ABZ0ZPH1_9ACTN|nr:MULTISPECIES: cation diffusion facilitator family transporter [unclassified Nocardioides]MDZ5619791.1 cation diffusion facilitator family transporter [Nocardioides sp. HM23]WQQ26202.1 cation diffusion facilitator family transporter [Nocardioides sp. HM61]
MGVGHGHGHSAARAADRRRLRWVLVVTGTVLVVEVVGAWITGSLALLADAGHMATDAGAVVLALGASYVAARPGGARSTFGYHRVEVMAALVNAVVLLGVCGYLAWAGVARLSDPPDVDGAGLVGFAVVGLLANAASLALLRGGDRSSLNLRGAINEVLADLVGSVLAIAAGVAIWVADWQHADPVASLVIAAMILPRAVLLIRDAGRVLLEIAPAELDLDDVVHHLTHAPGVVGVHDLHAWTITSGMISLSAHVTVRDEILEEQGVGAVLDALGDCVATHFDVRHTTFQVEPLSHQEHEDLGEMH